MFSLRRAALKLLAFAIFDVSVSTHKQWERPGSHNIMIKSIYFGSGEEWQYINGFTIEYYVKSCFV